MAKQKQSVMVYLLNMTVVINVWLLFQTLLCGTLTGMEARLGSMGKPAPGYDIKVGGIYKSYENILLIMCIVKIIDKDGNENDVGSEGEIAIKLAPKRPVGLFSGYLVGREYVLLIL